jgi:Baseplate J-like protein
MQQKPSWKETMNQTIVTPAEAGVSGEDTQPLTPEEEELETYHVYPLDEGIYIVKEHVQTPQDDQTIEATLVKKHPDFQAYGLLIFGAVLTLSCLAFSLTLALFPPIVTVTLISKTATVKAAETLQLVTGIPRQGQIHGRFLPPLTLSQAQTVITTGTGHQDATHASGLITLYNGQFSSQTIPAGTVLTGADGVVIVTDQEVSIPAGNPPDYGQTSVSAHALHAGSGGNIPAFDINEACCGASVLAKNLAAFSGGQDERSFHIVSQADIHDVVSALQPTLSQSMQPAIQSRLMQTEALFPLACTTTVIADHRVGEEAAHVKVTLLQTCQGIAYDTATFRQHVTTLLNVKALHQFGTGYRLVGEIAISSIQTTTTNKAVTLAFVAQGRWEYTLSEEAVQRLKNNLAGKTKQAALRYLGSLPGIQSATISGVEEEQRLPKSLSIIRIVSI